MTAQHVNAAFGLPGETALITGGASGLGLAMARCMVGAGARVALVGRREEMLVKAAEELNRESAGDGAVIAIAWDISRLESLPDLVRQVETRLGPLTILVNNAGIHLKKSSLETTDVEWSSVMQTHVSAAFALAREAARGMVQRGKGSILFVGSMASLMGVPSIAAYTAAKAAVVGLTRQLAMEWSPHGVRVNAIIPGWIKTDMTAAALDRDPPRKAKILSRTPMQRLGEPDDIGWAAVYLCSPGAQFVTGTTLVVDGGASIGF